MLDAFCAFIQSSPKVPFALTADETLTHGTVLFWRSSVVSSPRTSRNRRPYPLAAHPCLDCAIAQRSSVGSVTGALRKHRRLRSLEPHGNPRRRVRKDEEDQQRFFVNRTDNVLINNVDYDLTNTFPLRAFSYLRRITPLHASTVILRTTTFPSNYIGLLVSDIGHNASYQLTGFYNTNYPSTVNSAAGPYTPTRFCGPGRWTATKQQGEKPSEHWLKADEWT